MGFISFNLAYYRQELDALEAQPATEASIYRARRLVKMLDDLADEGYTALGTAMETAYQGPTRLRAYLRRAHAAPFPVADPASAAACPVWTEDTWELGQALDDARRAAAGVPVSGEPFLAELLRFCRWIGCEEDTAYVFLLRDTLLPCVYFQAAYGRERVHPWLLSRRALEGLLGKPGVDDELRAAIFQALEQPGAKDFGRFCGAVLPQMRRTLDRYPPLRDALTALLRSVPEKRILVVESGCSGTFPLLLKSLDPRVEAPDFINGCDCFVCSSHTETLSCVLNEAGACGKPVISTRCGGPLDIVTEERGLLVPTGDAQALAQAMLTMTETAARYDPARIRALTVETFGADRICDALLQACRDAAGSYVN